LIQGGELPVAVAVAATGLLEHGVAPWSEVPLWIPGDEGVGGNAFDVGKALAEGLSFRPLADTVADTLAWARSRPPDTPEPRTLSARRPAIFYGPASALGARPRRPVSSFGASIAAPHAPRAATTKAQRP
jgi:hypothetical protein